MVKKCNVARCMAFVLFVMLLSIFAINQPASAGGGYDFVPNMVKGVNSDGTVTVGTTLSVSIDDLEKSIEGFTEAYSLSEDMEVYWSVRKGTSDEGEKLIPVFNTSTVSFDIIVRPEDVGKQYTFYVIGVYNDINFNNNTDSYTVKAASSSETGTPKDSSQKSSIDISIDKKGIATVTGTTTESAEFTELRVDDFKVVCTLSGKSFKKTFDTKKYDIGYHNLSARMSNGKEITYPKAFPTAIYDTASLKASYFTTEPKKMAFNTPNYNNHIYDYYLQVKTQKDSWNNAALYGPFSPVVAKAITKLSPDTKYVCRAFYLKQVTYGGKKYYMVGPFSKEITVKTGPKAKPAVQSITASKAKIKKVWVKPLYKGIVLVHKGYWIYKTTYKVTVKMKKKPGIAGMYIHANGDSPSYRYVKGNKKSYTATFTITGKAIGKNTKVSLFTKGNKTYGACSPVYKKKIKIKK
ncbi:MAG: hypothetical protein K6G65_00135 [Lachnospiraceae bacterium]|nr:hypothetical protein [Lachnospiraceae bacterium]